MTSCKKILAEKQTKNPSKHEPKKVAATTATTATPTATTTTSRNDKT